jgi:hypothetical protein
MKNILFVIPLAFITAMFVNASNPTTKLLTSEKIKQIDSIQNLHTSKNKLPKLYYLDRNIKNSIDSLNTEIYKTELLTSNLKTNQ